MRLRKLIAAAGVATTVAGFGLVSAGQASAIIADCSGSHSVCLYYNPSTYGYGAVIKQGFDMPDYTNYYFSPSNNGSGGAGVPAKNNASAVDSWYGGTFTIYFSPNFSCSVGCVTIPAWATMDLTGAANDHNASGAFTGGVPAAE
ncbi:hypothetical protein ACIQF6_02190 [Kitasatospora sp. NPDC092948]|uniref:hypothetical protein n=1 Tax=Kitasatospora sp. NPDC092948 TaxID=3364088 RepID=UPI00382898EA